MGIPFVDLKAQYRAIAPEIKAAVDGVLENADFILGKDVERFEDEFARYIGAAAAVGVDTGISALELGLKALGAGPGDEVVTAANSFIASASAITFAGARPVLVDVDSATCNMDPGLLERAITPRTRAIMPVHLYGQPADMEPILEVARRKGIPVLEDACQAHGASYDGKRAGSLGDAAAFSFYPGKNLGAYGDGGLFATRDPALAEKVRILRNYGQKEKYHHIAAAHNKRLDTLQAAVLRVKLKRLDEWNSARRSRADQYRAALADSGVGLPAEGRRTRHVYHLFVVRCADRDGLQRHLSARGIATGIHYPIPIHMQECMRGLGYKAGDFPVTERLAREILSLPMFPELTREQVDAVAGAVKDFAQVRG